MWLYMKTKYCFNKEKKDGLLAGLYEFNTFDYPQEEELFLSTLDIEKIVPLKDSKHIFTHKEWHMSGKLVFIRKKIKGNLVSMQDFGRALCDTFSIQSV